MIKRTLREIQEICKGTGLKEEFYNIGINGVSTDSRDINLNKLFIPLVGENFDGHNFIKSAIENGAIAALWDKNTDTMGLNFPFILVDDTLKALQELAKFYRESIGVKVIGITGSNGKTSTKDILASILKTQYKTHKTLGNFNNQIGLPLTILEMDEDTEMAVLEMGMDNFGQIRNLTDIGNPEVGLITNIGEAHLEDLINRDNIGKAKLEIIEQFTSDNLFLYFGDEPILKEQVNNMDTNFNIKTYGFNSENDFIPEIISIRDDGVNFKISKPINQEFFIPLLGEHQVLNATAAIAIGLHYNISIDNIKKGLVNIEKTGMRNEIVKCKDYTILNDAYKSNPSSVLAALNTIYSMEGYKHKIVVLGDMLGLGSEEISMHKEIGKSINNNIDYCITYGDLAKYISDATKGNFKEDRSFHFTDKERLVEKIREIVQPNDLVLIKASRPLKMEEVIDELMK